MSLKRIILSIAAIVLMVAAGFFLQGSYAFWTSKLIYLSYFILALYFFALLVSNQQFEEDILAKTERITGAVILPYIVFVQFAYAPLARYFFGSLIQQRFFLSDLLALMMFLFFAFLWAVAIFILNSFSRFGLLPQLAIFNNSAVYYISRCFWPSAVLLTFFLFILTPFLIITV